MSLFWREGQPVDPEPDVLVWPQGRRMSELCGAAASVELKKLLQIIQHMQESNRRMRAQLEGTRGLQLRRLHDPEGDALSTEMVFPGNPLRVRFSAATVRLSHGFPRKASATTGWLATGRWERPSGIGRVCAAPIYAFSSRRNEADQAAE